MKNRLLWALIIAVGVAALYFGIARPQVSTLPKDLRDPLAELRPPPPPPIEAPALVIPDTPTVSLPALPPMPMPVVRTDPIPPKPEVPIQNQATIDFSTGAPVVRVQGQDKEALDAAIREIAEVAKGAKIEAKR